ncbi:MAG: outer membrane beta-barrel protein [Sulfurovaceae bacterium]|nr:outer membrane beta-barrel protein [Sulfurovaceae bacterium]
MKKFTLSVVTVLSMSAFAIAGGDIEPVEPEVVVPAPAPIVEDDSGVYLGVAYSAARYKGDFYADFYDSMDYYQVFGKYDVDFNAIMAQAGYKFNKYLALEGRYWHSLGSPEASVSADYYVNYANPVNISGRGGDHKMKAWGIYVKPMYPVTDKFDIYALLGYGNVKISEDYYGELLDENDFQWGIGALYKFTENLSLFVDYVRLLDKNGSFIYHDISGDYNADLDSTLYTINVGLTYKF